jgi:hypothetical protein
MKKQAMELSIGDRVDIGNGLHYEIEQVFENQNGRIRFILYPYQNALSARKKITFKENVLIDIIE